MSLPENILQIRSGKTYKINPHFERTVISSYYNLQKCDNLTASGWSCRCRLNDESGGNCDTRVVTGFTVIFLSLVISSALQAGCCSAVCRLAPTLCPAVTPQFEDYSSRSAHPHIQTRYTRLMEDESIQLFKEWLETANKSRNPPEHIQKMLEEQKNLQMRLFSQTFTFKCN